jgi:hypothetical protein
MNVPHKKCTVFFIAVGLPITYFLKCWRILTYRCVIRSLVTKLLTLNSNKCWHTGSDETSCQVRSCRTIMQCNICSWNKHKINWELGWLAAPDAGHAKAQLVEALHYKSAGRIFDSRWCHWNFLLTWSFRPHYGPAVDSVFNRSEYQEYFLGVKAAGA